MRPLESSHGGDEQSCDKRREEGERKRGACQFSRPRVRSPRREPMYTPQPPVVAHCFSAAQSSARRRTRRAASHSTSTKLDLNIMRHSRNTLMLINPGRHLQHLQPGSATTRRASVMTPLRGQKFPPPSALKTSKRWRGHVAQGLRPEDRMRSVASCHLYMKHRPQCELPDCENVQDIARLVGRRFLWLSEQMAEVVRLSQTNLVRSSPPCLISNYTSSARQVHSRFSCRGSLG